MDVIASEPGINHPPATQVASVSRWPERTISAVASQRRTSCCVLAALRAAALAMRSSRGWGSGRTVACEEMPAAMASEMRLGMETGSVAHTVQNQLNIVVPRSGLSAIFVLCWWYHPSHARTSAAQLSASFGKRLLVQCVWRKTSSEEARTRCRALCVS